MPLGGNFRTDKVARIHKDLDLVWTDTFTLLGVTFDSRMTALKWRGKTATQKAPMTTGVTYYMKISR